jgi:membrane associated rhomboid family serine protease
VLQLIPLSDRNPTSRTPFVTIALIAINVVVFLFVQPDFGSGPEASVFFFEEAPIPCQLEDECPDQAFQLPTGEVARIPDRDILSFIGASIYSTFMHAGFLHIAGNMLFLWVFGNNIEDFLGPVKFLAFYLLAGLAATFAHVLTNLDGSSSLIPGVGASGAVAGVMGAYIVLHPRARVRVLVPIFILWTILELSAFVVLGIWFLYQFLIAAQESVGGTGIAWMAHVGGFVFGVIAIFLLGGRPQRPQSQWAQTWRYYGQR